MAECVITTKYLHIRLEIRLETSILREPMTDIQDAENVA